MWFKVKEILNIGSSNLKIVELGFICCKAERDTVCAFLSV